MEIVDSTTHAAIHSGGFVVYCRYGLPHLICLPINRPDDPLLSPSLAHLKANNGYFASQFFANLHSNLNYSNILSRLFLHVNSSGASLSDMSEQELIDELAYFTSVGKLLVIPLYGH